MAEEKNNYELELFNAHICPFGQRAWFTILQKKIDTNLGDSFRIRWVDLKNKPAWFSEKYSQALGADPNSDGKAPTIQHNGKYMAESGVVAAYLDRVYSDESKYGPSLIPSDPFDAARVDLMIDFIGGNIMKPMFGLLMTKDENARLGVAEGVLTKLKLFNKKLLETSEKGVLLSNDNVSMFEILSFPFFYRYEAIEELTGIPLISKWLNPDCNESNGLERVISWYTTLNSLESVQNMRKIVTTPMLVELYRPWTVDLTFYNSAICPFGQRAWFALVAKNVKYIWKDCEIMDKDLKQDYFKEAYAKAIGRDETNAGKVPIIQHGKATLTESAQIVRYVDRVFPGIPLFPDPKEDPIASHAVECLVDWTSNIVGAFYKILTNDDREQHQKLIDKLYNDLKILCARLNEVSDSGLLLKSNEVSGFEVISFSFFWRMHLHPLLTSDSHKDVPIDKWLEKDSKEFPELSRVQDWWNTLYNSEPVQKMLNDKDHKITIQDLADTYLKTPYYSQLKN